jgi:hypothetical protein
VTPQVDHHHYTTMHHIVLGQGLFCDATAVSLVLATETCWKNDNKVMLYEYKDTLHAVESKPSEPTDPYERPPWDPLLAIWHTII